MGLKLIKLVVALSCCSYEKFLEDAVNTVREMNSKLLIDCVIGHVPVIAEDGPTDRSEEIAQRLSAQNSDACTCMLIEDLERGY